MKKANENYGLTTVQSSSSFLRFLLEYNSKPKNTLFFFAVVPNNVEDETAGCIHFADQFTNRYGECHPEFFPGSLEDAVKEACLKPAKDVSKSNFLS